MASDCILFYSEKDGVMLTSDRLLQMEATNQRLNQVSLHSNNRKWLDENRLTTKEAAAFLGNTPNALRIRVHRGKIPAEKLDTHLRFKLSSLISSFTQLEV